MAGTRKSRLAPEPSVVAPRPTQAEERRLHDEGYPTVAGIDEVGRGPIAGPVVAAAVVLPDLTDVTHGNATGLAMGDVITMKLFKKIDFGATYANVITATYLDAAMIPLIMNTPKEAVALAIKSVPRVKPLDCRVVWIKNTLKVAEIAVSEALCEQIKGDTRFEILGEPEAFRFDSAGELLPLEHAPPRMRRAAS